MKHTLKLGVGYILFCALLFCMILGILCISGVWPENFSIGEQTERFFSLRDNAVKIAVLGSVLLGVNCGILGSFALVRKMALMGDTLSHAVIPGIAFGFLWNLSKSPWALFIGASVTGLLGTFLVSILQSTKGIRNDSSLGMVLTGFYALGICLFTMIQNYEVGSKAGLDKYLFGQAAALSESDVIMMAIVTIASLCIMTLFYKEFLVMSFDRDFTQSLGFSTKTLHALFMILLTFAVVIALKASGAILVVSLLIAPAAAAYLLVERLNQLLLLAVIFAVFSSLSGAYFSFLGPRLPTGPFIVISASFLFFIVFLTSSKCGVLTRTWHQYRERKRIHDENILKAIYHYLEKHHFALNNFKIRDIYKTQHADNNTSCESKNREKDNILQKDIERLDKKRWVKYQDKNNVQLTEQGWQRACQIVRNHRLWELYLTHAADYALDHVHDDAEKIEHQLGDAIVKQIEERLNFPNYDPHGKLIPSLRDIEMGYSDMQSQKPNPLKL